MKLLTRLRRPIALALIGIAWLYRDQVAAGLDRNSQTYQTALTEAASQTQAQAQADDQREMLAMLRVIDVRVRALQGAANASEEEDVMRGSMHDAGISLQSRAEALGTLQKQVAADKDTDAAIARAKDVAGKLLRDDATPDQPLFQQWDEADAKLTAAYKKLTALAETERNDSQSTADGARALAWICTAIGGLLAGGWKGILGGRDTHDPQRSDSEEGSAAATAG